MWHAASLSAKRLSAKRLVGETSVLQNRHRGYKSMKHLYILSI